MVQIQLIVMILELAHGEIAKMDKYQKHVRLLSNDMLVNDMSHFVHPKDEEEEKYLLAFAEEIKRRLYPTNTNIICAGCVHHTKYGCDNLNPDLRLRVVCDGYEEWDGPEEDGVVD